MFLDLAKKALNLINAMVVFLSDLDSRLSLKTYAHPRSNTHCADFCTDGKS